jgi:hypothetical protein
VNCGVLVQDVAKVVEIRSRSAMEFKTKAGSTAVKNNFLTLTGATISLSGAATTERAIAGTPNLLCRTF